MVENRKMRAPMTYPTHEVDADSPALALPVTSPSLLRRPLLWVIVAALGLGGFALWQRLGGPDEQRPRYLSKPVARANLEKQISATGTVLARVTVTIGSQVSGRIHQLLVDYNARVKKGQVIARIDARIYRTEVDRARANLAAARAGVLEAQATEREARLQYERDASLAKKKVVATADVQTRLATYQAATAKVAAARASVAQARAALTQTRTNLAYTTIVSPIDGVVISRSVEVGQTVAASLQAPTLFTIAEDLRQMEVHTSVAESDVGMLREGMTARFAVDAFPGESFEGVVKQVRFEATTVQNVVTYDAVIQVANPQLKLRPGMTATVTFIVAARKDVLSVPNAALRFRLPGRAGSGRAGPGRQAAAGSKLLWVLRGTAPSGALETHRVVVETGLSNSSATEVTRVVEGTLKPGDAVVVGLGGKTASKTDGRGGRGGRGGRRGPPRIL